MIIKLKEMQVSYTESFSAALCKSKNTHILSIFALTHGHRSGSECDVILHTAAKDSP